MAHDIDEAALRDLLDAVYDAAVSPESWPVVLERLAGVFNAGFVDIFTRSRDRRHFSGLAYGLDRADYDDNFLGFWFKRNIWGNTKPVEIAGEVVSTRQMVDLAELRRSEIFNQYLDPRGLHEGLRLSLWVDDDEVQDISILRPWSCGAFGPAEVELGQVLLPHLQRAATVTRRLLASKATLDGEGMELGSSDLAVFVFDAAGLLLRMNPMAERLLDDDDLLSLTGNRLRGSTPALSNAIQKAVARATGQAGPLREGGSVALPKAGGTRPLNLIVLPLFDRRGWATARPPAAMAVLRDPAARTLPRDLARSMFPLTDSEADLAQHMLQGWTLREVADRTGRSLHTVRSHMARLMEKTETKRQADLLRLLEDVAVLGSTSPNAMPATAPTVRSRTRLPALP